MVPRAQVLNRQMFAHMHGHAATSQLRLVAQGEGKPQEFWGEYYWGQNKFRKFLCAATAQLQLQLRLVACVTLPALPFHAGKLQAAFTPALELLS